MKSNKYETETSLMTSTPVLSHTHYTLSTCQLITKMHMLHFRFKIFNSSSNNFAFQQIEKILNYFLQAGLPGQAFLKMEHHWELLGEVWRVVDFYMEMLKPMDYLEDLKMPTFIQICQQHWLENFHKAKYFHFHYVT